MGPQDVISGVIQAINTGVAWGMKVGLVLLGLSVAAGVVYAVAGYGRGGE